MRLKLVGREAGAVGAWGAPTTACSRVHCKGLRESSVFSQQAAAGASTEPSPPDPASGGRLCGTLFVRPIILILLGNNGKCSSLKSFLVRTVIFDIFPRETRAECGGESGSLPRSEEATNLRSDEIQNGKLVACKRL